MARLRVAFQGERGAFSQTAVEQLLGKTARVHPCQRFDEVFESVMKGAADAAVVPIENTLHGSVHENYDHLLNFDLPIVGETYVRIAHNLITRKGVSLGQIRRVYSHPVALNQCLKFFREHSSFERVPFYDTAGSVKMVVEKGLADAGAIASARSAEIYDAQIIKHNIEDDPSNFTRFFLLRRSSVRGRPESGKGWKTTLVFGVPNTAGVLFRCLGVFALRDISLLKIESRPLRGRPWEYLFYLDFDGSVHDIKCQKALGHLEELANFVKVLGSYPKGEEPEV